MVVINAQALSRVVLVALAPRAHIHSLHARTRSKICRKRWTSHTTSVKVCSVQTSAMAVYAAIIGNPEFLFS